MKYEGKIHLSKQITFGTAIGLYRTAICQGPSTLNTFHMYLASDTEGLVVWQDGKGREVCIEIDTPITPQQNVAERLVYALKHREQDLCDIRSEDIFIRNAALMRINGSSTDFSACTLEHGSMYRQADGISEYFPSSAVTGCREIIIRTVETEQTSGRITNGHIIRCRADTKRELERLMATVVVNTHATASVRTILS